jgi:hypothetical protein
MSRKHQPDPIDRLKEWQDHAYNPGYWINRFPLGFPPKPSRGFWILALIDVFICIPVFVALLLLYLSEHDSMLVIPLILFGGFAVLATLRLPRLRPPRTGREGSTDGSPEDPDNESDRGRGQHHVRKKKKLPKRRKDYR